MSIGREGSEKSLCQGGMAVCLRLKYSVEKSSESRAKFAVRLYNAVKKSLVQYLSEKIWSKVGMEAQAN